MAIDNNTSYELTGAQIKDLAQKIRNKADDNTFVGSSSGVAGSKGLVPAPAAGDQKKVLSGSSSWVEFVSGIQVVSGSYTRALAVGDNYQDIDVTSIIPSGYAAVGIVGLDMSGSGYTQINITKNYVDASSNTWHLSTFSNLGYSTSIVFTIYLLCVKVL